MRHQAPDCRRPPSDNLALVAPGKEAATALLPRVNLLEPGDVRGRTSINASPGREALLAARVRLFDTGHNRKTDAHDAHAVAAVAVRTKTLRVLQLDGELEALRMLTDRREALPRRRVPTVDRLQALLAELLPGQAKRDLTTGQVDLPLHIDTSDQPLPGPAGKTLRRTG